MSGLWRKAGTTPAEIDAALQGLLRERHEDGGAHSPARALNLVAVVDRRWRGEIANRLERVGRYHPSRTIVCAVEQGRADLEASAAVLCEDDCDPQALAPCRERVEVEVGTRHVPYLDSIVAPLLVADLATVVWSPHRFPEAVDCLAGVADVMLVDSADEPSMVAALERDAELASKVRVVDLAWLRTTSWRERVAAALDPEPWRAQLAEVSAVTVRHRDSAVLALLLVAWLASRLGWKPRGLVSHDGTVQGRLRGARQHVDVRMEAAHDVSAAGLQEITIETARGSSLRLERAPGGLSAVEETPGGRSSAWTAFMAHHEERNILGDGIRQALLGDPTYVPALEAARAMLR